MKDRQSLVDRIIFRLKNNPIVAVVIIAGLALGSLASFTDSISKIIDIIPKFVSPVQVTGEWRSEALREPGTEAPPWQYYFKLRAHGTDLFGTVYFIEPPGSPPEGPGRAILNGKIDGNKLSFEYLGGWGVKELFYGAVSRDEIDFTYQRDRAVAIEFIAKKVPDSGVAVVK